MDMNAASRYLHDVFARLVANRYATLTEVSDLTPPPGLGLIMRGDRVTKQIVSGFITFDPPVRWADLEPLAAEVVEEPDGLTWVLLEQLDGQPDEVQPSRVTIALPKRPVSASDAIEGALLTIPDRFTAPTGIQYGMTLSDRSVVDVASNVPADGPFAAIIAAVGTDQPRRDGDTSGLRWCDGPAQHLDGFVHDSEWFGMPPSFVPMLSLGVDGITLGFIWDRPESESIDDSTLYAISPGQGFRLEAKLPFVRWLATELGRHGADSDVDPDLNAAIIDALGARRTKPLTDGFPRTFKRTKPKDLSPDERWLTVPNGDGIRVPLGAVAPQHPRSFVSPDEARVWSAQAWSNGFAGSAYWAAYRALVLGAEHRDAFEMHAAYHAMIEPLQALGRSAIADRCRAIVDTARPITVRPPPPPPPVAPVWMEPTALGHTAHDVTVSLLDDQPMTVEVDGLTLEIPVDRFGPLELADLPAGTAVALLDSGLFAVSPDDRIATCDRRPVSATLDGGHLIVVSEREQPGLHLLQFETAVPWLDEQARIRPVRYLALKVVPDTYTAELEQQLLTIRNMADVYTAKWPFALPDVTFRSAVAEMGVGALDLDAIPSTGPYGKQLHGIVVTDRCADIITTAGAATLPVVSISVRRDRVERRYLNLPVSVDVDFERTTFVAADVDTSTMVERLGAGAFTDAQALVEAARSDRFEYPIMVGFGVTVLNETPPILHSYGAGILVRADVRDELHAADVTGFEYGTRSLLTFVVT